MKENTFTFTARSAIDPEKIAMFTLHNGSVSVQLASALMEQVDAAYDSLSEEETNGGLRSWFKPVATGSLQKLLKPVPLVDFNAEMDGDALQTTAWIRAGGLRLLPMMMTWKEVDNTEGARAFVSELQERKNGLPDGHRALDLLDYWGSWIVIGSISIALPVLLFKKWQERRSS